MLFSGITSVPEPSAITTSFLKYGMAVSRPRSRRLFEIIKKVVPHVPIQIRARVRRPFNTGLESRPRNNVLISTPGMRTYSALSVLSSHHG